MSKSVYDEILSYFVEPRSITDVKKLSGRHRTTIYKYLLTARESGLLRYCGLREADFKGANHRLYKLTEEGAKFLGGC